MPTYLGHLSIINLSKTEARKNLCSNKFTDEIWFSTECHNSVNRRTSKSCSSSRKRLRNNPRVKDIINFVYLREIKLSYLLDNFS